MSIYARDSTFAQPPDAEAEITFVQSEAGGRSSPAFSGYSPQFHYRGHDWAAVHEYPDTQRALPGETVRAFLRFVHPEAHVGHIHPGSQFQIREGLRVVGHGHITRILHLAESAKQFSNEEKTYKALEATATR